MDGSDYESCTSTNLTQIHIRFVSDSSLTNPGRIRVKQELTRVGFYWVHNGFVSSELNGLLGLEFQPAIH